MNKRLLVKKQGKFIPGLTLIIPPNGIVSVGSDASATIELEDETIAPEQFVIVCEGGQMTLLCRVDKTSVNGLLLPKGSLHNLELHDTIAVGDYLLTVETGEEAEKMLAAEAVESSASDEESAAAAAETAGNDQETATEVDRPQPPEENSPEGDKSLSDVLEGLKAEEKFYFLIENGSREKHRIYIEAEEMWLGWTASGECAVSENAADIAMPRAQIRKDWSGVVLYPLKNRNVWLNRQVLDEPHRLKNDDTLQLLGREKSLPDAKTSIKFHEPTALLVLDSILPKELPPPVSLDKRGKSFDTFNEGQAPGTVQSAEQTIDSAVTRGNARLFGYFTGLEILIMVIGILVAAALIFLVLEYY